MKHLPLRVVFGCETNLPSRMGGRKIGHWSINREFMVVFVGGREAANQGNNEKTTIKRHRANREASDRKLWSMLKTG